MANSYPCPACCRPGPPAAAICGGGPVYRCPAVGCDVVEYDRDLILRRQGLPLLPAAPRRVRVQRIR